MSNRRVRLILSVLVVVGMLTAAGSTSPASATQAGSGSAAAPAGVGDASCFAPGPHGFSDVASGSYYNTAVAWLVEAGITGGTTPTKFSPNNPVTRAQMATFLWHNADDPTPTTPNTFTDIPTGSYYNTAVSWLVEAGITGGTTPTKFSPNNPVTRAQMATFLWHNADDPTPTAPHNFTDVPTGSYYNTAVSWLVEAGITGGTTPTKFSPNNPVTRAQMATFLWKDNCGPAPSTFVSFDAGGAHTCALKADRTVACWGNNQFGQLGDGTTTNRLVPTPVEGLANVTAISAGYYHSCAVITDKTVKCWGDNFYGELGDATTNDRLTPTPVPGLTNVAEISAGSRHTCALTIDQTAKCWGDNELGSLGDGTTTQRLTPTSVTGLTNTTAITASTRHTCAITTDKTVKCWGDNDVGEVGDGTTTNRTTPTPVPGLTDITAITTGGHHTCALAANGTAKCWGENFYGGVGDGTFINRSTPTPVTGLTSVATISAGSLHTCATTSGGTAKCWGYNGDGRLGDGTTADERLTPTPVTGLTAATTISAGSGYTCALTTDGAARCWGSNSQGQLGDGTTTNRNTPTPVAGLT